VREPKTEFFDRRENRNFILGRNQGGGRV